MSTSSSDQCPNSCPLINSGCYGKSGPIAWHWNRVNDGRRGGDWQSFLEQVKSIADGQIWRHNQVGDLPGIGDNIDGRMMGELAAANGLSRGYTYTHKPMSTSTNKDAVQLANDQGFTVNLSADNLNEADELKALAIAPVVTILPIGAPNKQTTAAGNTVIKCPAQSRDDITCATCKLCAVSNRKVIIGFEAHGTAAKKASAIAIGA